MMPIGAWLGIAIAIIIILILLVVKWYQGKKAAEAKKQRSLDEVDRAIFNNSDDDTKNSR